MKAIILSAGMGTRLKEWTEYMPKPLFKINHKPITEINIDFLISKKKKKIVLVVGYKAEKFEYLKDKYKHINLKILYNDKYDIYNSCYSMKIAKNELNDDILVLLGDTVIYKNFTLASYVKQSSLFVQKTGESWWLLDFDKDSREITKIYRSPNSIKGYYLLFPYNENNPRMSYESKNSLKGYTMANISFLKKEILPKYIAQLEQSKETDYYETSLMRLLNSGEKMFASLLRDNSVYEVDTLQDAIKSHLITEQEFWNEVKKMKTKE